MFKSSEDEFKKTWVTLGTGYIRRDSVVAIVESSNGAEVHLTNGSVIPVGGHADVWLKRFYGWEYVPLKGWQQVK